MNTAACNPKLDHYFGQLESRLSDLPKNRREDFLLELRAHVLDRLAQIAVPGDEDCDAVLKALGTPEEIARQYRLELLLSRSSWKVSPLAVLRTMLRWAVAGVQGWLIFCLALVGYMFSACFYIAAVLKPFFPHNVGAFVSAHSLNLARFPNPPAGHDVLGPYFIPVSGILGYLFTLGTTLLIRWINRRSRILKQLL